MGNRFKLETVLLTHKTHQPLALATLIFQYSVLSAHEQLMSSVKSLQLLQYVDY